jgi:hypothetical protein
VYIRVVNYPAGMEISTCVIEDIDMLCASIYDPSGDMTKWALMVANNWKQRSVFAVYISVELE